MFEVAKTNLSEQEIADIQQFCERILSDEFDRERDLPQMLEQWKEMGTPNSATIESVIGPTALIELRGKLTENISDPVRAIMVENAQQFRQMLNLLPVDPKPTAYDAGQAVQGPRVPSAGKTVRRSTGQSKKSGRTMS